MKLVTFDHGGHRIGVVVGDAIIDLSGVADIPQDMNALIAGWSSGVSEIVKQVVQHRQPDFGLQDVRLVAPIPRPGKLLGTGLNYADHVVESGLPFPESQIWFSMPASAVNGPQDDVQLPIVSNELDYEAELVFVIGQRCRHVPRERAPEVIFGYCAGNDFSVRDWQLRTSQVLLGKSFDGHAPFGPWIVTKDEIENPHDLGIRCFVNGEQRQASNTREMIFNCYDQIALLSQVMTLEPGDVVFTGTPAGVGLGYKPPKWLKVGDAVRVEIDEIGIIENTVVAEPRI
ncbi:MULTISPECIES: fumarylacetoacetate hydrolase family protein [Achromobacter]|uniref:fumarylacetoacetate hydrolase family protein n=1 Tax=Achromobacter TaxID=222 RepID=UPI001C46C934|nr:fumarylacetoacetate hydrolase family protein [Achromobacter sp. ACM05]MBV7499825.1 fumarylacetoacetate hydrolase family protein [Achromobacter sp. ACM05]